MEEINLYDLLKYYVRNWLILLSAVLVGAAIGIAYTAFVQVPLYKSEATMLVVDKSSSATATTINNNYTEVFESRLVLETVIDQQGYKGDYAQLLSRTTATNDKNTDVLKVSIADPDASKSQRLLSAAVQVFSTQVGKIYGSSNIKTVDTASLPSRPYNVNVPLQVGLATAAVFFLAVIVLFFMYDYTMSYKGSAGAGGKKTKTTATKKQTSTKKVVKKSKQSGASRASSAFERLGVMLTGEEKSTAKRS